MTETMTIAVQNQQKPRTLRHNRIKQLWRRDAPTLVWGVVFLVIVLAALFGPFLLQSHTEINPIARLQGPSPTHIFGTDEYGRDLFSRVVFAGRTSLGIGLAITSIAVILGVFIGAAAGFYRASSGVLMRVMDGVLAFPPIVLAMALVITTTSGVFGEIIALGIVFIPYVARVVRSRVLSIRERGFVAAAKAAGVSGPVIIVKHVLPNAASAILVQSVFIYASALLADASLSFLGLGVQPPTPTWGNMIGDGRYFITAAPGFIVFPGIAIVLSVLSLNMLGEGIRGMIDPRARAILELESVRARLAKAMRKTHRNTLTGVVAKSGRGAAQ